MGSVGFSGEINRGIHLLGSEENDIIKQYPEKPKGGQFQSLLFSLILQPVKINKPGAPLLGYYYYYYYYYIYYYYYYYYIYYYYYFIIIIYIIYIYIYIILIIILYLCDD